jgi:hypothetical protein
MVVGREWVHGESGDGSPSAAAYRTGCRCGECRDAYREYMRRYRAGAVALAWNDDGTAVYHSHGGRPSAAAGWDGCGHPRCMALAGIPVFRPA